MMLKMGFKCYLVWLIRMRLVGIRIRQSWDYNHVGFESKLRGQKHLWSLLNLTPDFLRLFSDRSFILF